MSYSASLFPRSRFLRSGVWRTALLVLALMLACAGAAHANSWLPGAVITYDQSGWAGAGAALLVSNYVSVYAGNFGTVTLGLPSPGFSMSFDASSKILAYLPASGPPGPLTSNTVNPTTTPAGSFGGDVLALQLDVDFSSAGLLVGTSGIPFGNLILTNFSTLPNLNGLTVSQFLGDANTCLGGGSCLYSVGVMDTVAADLGGSFQGGIPGTFTNNGLTFSAQTNLAAPGSVTPVPEPSSLLLLGTGLLGLGWTRRFKRAR